MTPQEPRDEDTLILKDMRSELLPDTVGRGKGMIMNQSLKLLYAMQHGLTGLKIPNLKERPEVECALPDCEVLTNHTAGYCSKECKQKHKLYSKRRAQSEAIWNILKANNIRWADAFIASLTPSEDTKPFVSPKKEYRRLHKLKLTARTV